LLFSKRADETVAFTTKFDEKPCPRPPHAYRAFFDGCGEPSGGGCCVVYDKEQIITRPPPPERVTA
jgi:hypothetical protein